MRDVIKTSWKTKNYYAEDQQIFARKVLPNQWRKKMKKPYSKRIKEY